MAGEQDPRAGVDDAGSGEATPVVTSGPARHSAVPRGFTVAPDGEELLEPHWMNLPNALTFLRVLLVPVILALLFVDGDAARWWAFGIFVFAAVTDSIDGWVARRWNGVTRWGQLADPIADKLLVLGSLTALALVDELPWWAVVVILAREVAVTALRLQLVNRRRLVLPASVWGKAKTVSQVVAIAAILAPGIDGGVATSILYVAIVLTMWSGIDYAFLAGRVARSVADDDTAPARHTLVDPDLAREDPS